MTKSWRTRAWEITDWPDGQRYPDTMISRPMRNENGEVVGRQYVWEYRFRDDHDGTDGLRYGAMYYDEAMSYAEPTQREMRIECFQAAELLYLHAAEHGHPYGWLDLGYVYYYDRCEGRYAYEMFGKPGEPVPSREERAFECLHTAAEAGLAQACYKLGDVYKEGMGCEPDASEAVRWYQRAAELAEHEDVQVWGSSALRLGVCFENGIGCEQSFATAERWYKIAESALEITVRHGNTWYKRSLADAKSGARRMRQEIDGRY